MTGDSIDTLISYGLAGLYYAAALGWLVALLAGLVLLAFRGKRRWGAVVLAIGVMWVGFHLVMEWKYVARYQRVVQRFDEIEEGMSEAEVREILGEPTERWGPAPELGEFGGQWVYRRERWMCYPRTSLPFWRVEPLHKAVEVTPFGLPARRDGDHVVSFDPKRLTVLDRRGPSESGKTAR